MNTTSTRRYETDEDYNSKFSAVKFGWRQEEQNILENHMVSVPKGQVVILLAGRFMNGGKLDPRSEVSLGIKRGTWNANQVIAVDGSDEVVRSNAAAKRLGITLIHGDFAAVVEEVSKTKQIAYVSADFMQTYLSIGDQVGRIMRALNQENQPKFAMLFLNGSILQRRAKKLSMQGKLDNDPQYYLSKSKEFRFASTDLNPTFPSIWKRQRFFKDDAQHVTNRCPMKSCLFVKTENPEFGNKFKKMTKNMETRIGLRVVEKMPTTGKKRKGNYSAGAKKAWATRRALAKKGK